MDVRRGADDWEMPAELQRLTRPIVGYAGNLSHRIDWELLDAVAAARPDWSFVIIGEPPAKGPYRRIASRPNVHPLGVIPYEAALRYIAHFDVAMIPHAHSAISENMNPLKLYVYRGLGVPGWCPPPWPISTICRRRSGSRIRPISSSPNWRRRSRKGDGGAASIRPELMHAYS